MTGYLALVLHAHLPFVRHPEHERFLEESWLFEAVVECYLPLLERLERWQADGIRPRLSLVLSPTLCAMLGDPLLQARIERRLGALVDLAARETHRCRWEPALATLAEMYHRRFVEARAAFERHGRDLALAFAEFERRGAIDIVTCSATHALLPLLATHPPSLRGQLLTARDAHTQRFGRAPRGIWLPECAYTPELEPALIEAGLKWFVLDTHGLLHATPRPRYGVFAPVFTAGGLAAFGRDLESARQVWSRHEGYPGDPRYRDFYRDIGFDLDLDYVRPALPSPEHRGFTGIKYHAIGQGKPGPEKPIYDRGQALRAAAEHAAHFAAERRRQISQAQTHMDRPPLVVAPYDAELFGHWWHEGIEFLDALVREIAAGDGTLQLCTPEDYLARQPVNQVAVPSPSSWGEEGFYRAWLNETNEWILPHLHVAQERMTELARRSTDAPALTARAVRQAARELLLAQASDWPFILRAGTSPDYARRRVKDHLVRFHALYDQVRTGAISADWVGQVEAIDNLFPDIRPDHWLPAPGD